MHPIELQSVWKRYHLGSKHDSLRDMIPALLKRWAGREAHPETPKNEFWALKDVSFHVKKGETLGIIGPNGAGKSTLLKILSRIAKQTRGAIRVQGRLAALIELGGGFHPDLSGRENIYLQGTMLGLSRREIVSRFDSIVAFSELESFLDTPVKRYSSGMVVKLGFAIAAHIHPDILLLDEVLAVGDIGFQQKCFRRIDALRSAGTTMIFISHNLEAVHTLCDRVLLLRHGQVAEEGEPGAVIQRFREEMLGHVMRDEAAASTGNSTALAQLTDVALKDADGMPLETLTTGEPLLIEVSYQANQPIANPMFRVAIERFDGLLCHATASRRHGVVPETLRGEGTLTLTYPAVPLLPNLYHVTVELFEDGNPIPVASLRRHRIFQIISDGHDHGTVQLEHSWLLQHP
ncbi:MAG: ABC transporter ATP-binding protein [Candidatus Omnitrophica bacterium]|nr:ABC transporter ATP-binding protein [Candidatus Omnitrophota bacterium]